MTDIRTMVMMNMGNDIGRNDSLVASTANKIDNDDSANLLLHFQHPTTNQTPGPMVHYYNHHDQHQQDQHPLSTNISPQEDAVSVHTPANIGPQEDTELIAAYSDTIPHIIPSCTTPLLTNDQLPHAITNDQLSHAHVQAQFQAQVQSQFQHQVQHQVQNQVQHQVQQFGHYNTEQNAASSVGSNSHHSEISQNSSNSSSSSNTNNAKWSKNANGDSIELVLGKFTPEETATINASIKEYCDLKSISVKALCGECLHSPELKGAWMQIAKALPHRSVQSIYRHGMRQWHPYKRGPWTKKEVDFLSDLVHRYGKKWSFIQSLLYRSADACRDKYRELSNDYIKGRWQREESNLLIKTVREVIKAPQDSTSHILQLQQFITENKIVVPWSTVSKILKKRSRLSCLKKWQKLTASQEKLNLVINDSIMATMASMSKKDTDYYLTTAITKNQLSVLATAHIPNTIDIKDQHILDEEAKLAAQTVEAVNLPTIPPIPTISYNAT